MSSAVLQLQQAFPCLWTRVSVYGELIFFSQAPNHCSCSVTLLSCGTACCRRKQTKRMAFSLLSLMCLSLTSGSVAYDYVQARFFLDVLGPSCAHFVQFTVEMSSLVCSALLSVLDCLDVCCLATARPRACCFLSCLVFLFVHIIFVVLASFLFAVDCILGSKRSEN